MSRVLITSAIPLKPQSPFPLQPLAVQQRRVNRFSCDMMGRNNGKQEGACDELRLSYSRGTPTIGAVQPSPPTLPIDEEYVLRSEETC